MKIKQFKVIVFLGVASLASAFAQSKYSGIYDLDAGGRVLFAMTKGGHILSVSSAKTSLNHQLDPATSTVNASGKVVGSVPDGTSVVAKIASDFTITGTAKSDHETVRITGARTLD